MNYVARRTTPLALGCALMLSLAACDSGPTESTEPEMADITSILALAGAASATFRAPGEFHYEIDCPAGGKIVADDEFHTLTEVSPGRLRIEWKSQLQFLACTVSTANNGRTSRTDGALEISGFAVHELPAETGGTVKLVENQTHQEGRLTWTTDGESHTCDIDLTLSVDMARRIVRVTGTRCGQRVDLEHRLPDFVH